MSELAEPIAERPNVDIDADEPAPEARLVPEVSAVDDDVRVVNSDSCDVDDEDDIDEAAEASPGSASVWSGPKSPSRRTTPPSTTPRPYHPKRPRRSASVPIPGPMHQPGVDLRW
jgi:hypothetical protein